MNHGEDTVGEAVVWWCNLCGRPMSEHGGEMMGKCPVNNARNEAARCFDGAHTWLSVACRDCDKGLPTTKEWCAEVLRLSDLVDEMTGTIKELECRAFDGEQCQCRACSYDHAIGKLVEARKRLVRAEVDLAGARNHAAALQQSEEGLRRELAEGHKKINSYEEQEVAYLDTTHYLSERMEAARKLIRIVAVNFCMLGADEDPDNNRNNADWLQGLVEKASSILGGSGPLMAGETVVNKVGPLPDGVGIMPCTSAAPVKPGIEMRREGGGQSLGNELTSLMDRVIELVEPYSSRKQAARE